MRYLKSSVQVEVQEPGLIGMYKFAEKVGRIPYKSEEKITEDSYIKFNKMLYSKGHWAVFNLPTVYLKIPLCDLNNPKIEEFYKRICKLDSLYAKVSHLDGRIYITCTLRTIYKLGAEDLLEKYWSDNRSIHPKRLAARFVVSRGISDQIIRHHRLFPTKESQRYINYSKKGGSIVVPEWVYEVGDLNGIKKPDDSDITDYITKLSGCDKTVSVWTKHMEDCVERYNYVTTTNEGYKLKPESARGLLCQDFKSELCVVGWEEDWTYENEEQPEKAGFFTLRTKPDAQVDLRVLAERLHNEFKEKGLIS